MLSGTIIEESLQNKSVLQHVKVVSTEISPVSAEDNTSHVKQWTMHKVEIEEAAAMSFARELSTSLEASPTCWYADFKNEQDHYVVYPNKVFLIQHGHASPTYEDAKSYGRNLGIPEHQLDFA